MIKTIKNIEDVVKGHLCSGCGACAFLSDDITMIDDVSVGRRPIFTNSSDEQLLDACPGWKLSRDDAASKHPNLISSLYKQWGGVIEVWEAYASDGQIRRSGSSGGVITALSLYCLEVGEMAGVLNTHAGASDPVINETSISKSREQLLSATGSRYSPSSPCEKLNEIEKLDGSCVFVGKPCDAAAVYKVRRKRKEVDQKLGVVISFFCAGVPSTLGVKQLIKKVTKGKQGKVGSLRFRGNGWPGLWRLKYKVGKHVSTETLTYQDSWGFLQKYRQWRCHICPDHTGEFSDISVGDPWYRPADDEQGKSLVLIRTDKGRRILHAAVDAGYIVLGSSDPAMLAGSQPNLISAKAVLWGRIFALKISGAASPIYTGFGLFEFWLNDLTFKQKFLSIAGTVKRVFLKKLFINYTVKKVD